MNHNRRHAYYVKRTCEWLRTLEVLIDHPQNPKVTETTSTSYHGPTPVYRKEDLWGADILFATHTECSWFHKGLHAIQLKTSSRPATLSLGKKQLINSPWPPDVGLYVIHWNDGGRLKDGPNIINARS